MIKVKNDQVVKDILVNVTPKVARNLVRSTVHGVAGEIRDDIKRNAPDDPRTRKGDLVRSTKTKREKPKGWYFASTVRIHRFYWRFLEFGTVKLVSRPFVLPAAKRAEADLVQTFRTQFGKKLEAMLARVRK